MASQQPAGPPLGHYYYYYYYYYYHYYYYDDDDDLQPDDGTRELVAGALGDVREM